MDTNHFERWVLGLKRSSGSSSTTLISKTAEEPFKDLLTEETAAASSCDISGVFPITLCGFYCRWAALSNPRPLLPPTLPTGPWGCVK